MSSITANLDFKNVFKSYVLEFEGKKYRVNLTNKRFTTKLSYAIFNFSNGSLAKNPPEMVHRWARDKYEVFSTQFFTE